MFDGSRLYGFTTLGGADDLGSVVTGVPGWDPGIQLIHHFTGGSADGAELLGSPLLVGNALYGTTSRGGVHDLGTIFAMQTDGSGFRLLHSFGGEPGGGIEPRGTLVFDGSTLYGMTRFGGSANEGTVFALTLDEVGVPEPSTWWLLVSGLAGLVWVRRRRG